MAPMKKKAVALSRTAKGRTITKPLSKKPAAAPEGIADEMETDAVPLLKKPSAASKFVNDEEGDANGNATQEENEASAARNAVSAVRKQQRFIDRLLANNESLAQKIKNNKGELRKAEKEMEAMKEVAKKHTRKLGAKKSAQMRKKMLGKKIRAQAKGERAAALLKNTQKRLNGLRRKAAPVKDKADNAEQAYKRAQRAYDEAKKKCKQLKDAGEDVPDEGEKDVSAPGAYKSPGIRAAKERDALKATLPKLKATWEKASEIASKKLKIINSLKEKINHAKMTQELAEEEANSSRKKRPAAK